MEAGRHVHAAAAAELERTQGVKFYYGVGPPSAVEISRKFAGNAQR
jgi:hypothetical protein